MRIFFFLVFLLIITVLAPLLAGRLLRLTNKHIWKSTILNYSGKFLLPGVLLFALIWFLGAYINNRDILIIGVTGTSIVILFSFILLITLPVSIAYKKLLQFLHNLRQPKPVDQSRRALLKYGAAALPAIAVGSTSTGVAQSFMDVRFPKIPIYINDLPEKLNDFTIFHLSDLHLGYYLHVQDLEKILLPTLAHKIDLIIITGDIADDLSQLADSLRLIEQLYPDSPKFISLGNHEYHRGIQQVYKAIGETSIPLLKSEGLRILHKGEPIFIAGADDPVHLNRDIHTFLDQTVNKAVKNATDNDLKILMSHRPRALDVAANYNIDLVLSGHTHGGQFGFNGRSFFEPIASENYLWGHYKKGKSQLYTSSGVGHWFPFRLGCPPEAPLITLKNKV